MINFNGMNNNEVTMNVMDANEFRVNGITNIMFNRHRFHHNNVIHPCDF
ncbi:hypothetical protein [Paenibacillus sp. L3-i20]|nr:hypothetical protein [Paenibacillus sp. L3-i20]GKU77657.1 hypothetical protein L3i20_v220540 [Paenibacillus sp. L3-i20]